MIKLISSARYITVIILFTVIGGAYGNNTVENGSEKSVKKFVVRTKNGPVQGIIEKSRNETKEYVAFLGLRYAETPKRFEAPSPLMENWTIPRLANKPGSMCPQIGFGEGGEIFEDEDCLFLNVFVPKIHLEQKGTKKLPVMIWIHGGGYAFGDGFGYKPDYFMENEDIILITINYRLGALGFVTTEDDVLIGNNGLRDQVMSLKWVRDNIAKFNGNPKNVTVFGNSAGSASIHYLIMSPRAKGLFQKAIMQSGAFSFWSYSPNPREMAFKLATHLGCDLLGLDVNYISENIRRCLERKSVKQILLGQHQFYPRWPESNPIVRFTPTAIETESRNPFFSRKPKSFFTAENGETPYSSNKISVLAGVVSSEGSTLFGGFVLGDDKLTDNLDTMWDQLAPKTFSYDSFFPDQNLGEISSQLRKFYFGNAQQITNKENDYLSKITLSNLYSDALFTLPVMTAVKDMAAAGLKVYPYVFDYKGSWSVRKGLGMIELPGMIGHGDEMQYQFLHEMFGAPLEVGSNEEKFSRQLLKYWIHFAKHGKPAQEFAADEEKILLKPVKKQPTKTVKETYSIDIDVLMIDAKPKVVKYELSKKLQFWNDLLAKNLDVATNEKRNTKGEL